jgi:hypothetical protein
MAPPLPEASGPSIDDEEAGPECAAAHQATKVQPQLGETTLPCDQPLLVLLAVDAV